MFKAAAWVVIEDNKILVRTIMDSERGAMVNWLVTECNIPIMNTMSDETISKLFRREQDARGGPRKVSVKLCEVWAEK